MSIKTLVRRSRELFVCGLGALHLAGCGGAVFSGDGDSGAGGSAAGAGSSAGAGAAGSASGGAGSGGAGPTCVPDPDACAQDQAGYASLRQMLLQGTGATACKTDSDCTRLAVIGCGDACFGAPVSAKSAPSINNQLSSYAADHCSTCTPIGVSCASEPPVACIDSVCVAGGYL